MGFAILIRRACWKIRVYIFTSFHVITVKKDSVELFNKVRNGKSQDSLALGYFLSFYLISS